MDSENKEVNNTYEANSGQSSDIQPNNVNFQQSLPQAPLAPPAKPSKSYKKLVIILTIIFVLVLLGLGALYLKNKDQNSNMNNASSESSSSSSQDSENMTSQFDPAVDVARIANDVDEQFPGTSSTNEASVGEVILFDKDTGHLIVVESEEGWGRFFSFSGGNESQYFYIIDQLKTNGFTESSLDQELVDFNSESIQGTQDKITYLTNGVYTCKVSTFSSDRLYFDCIDNSTVSAKVDEIMPFYDAYKSANEDSVVYDKYIISVGETENAKKFTDYEVVKGGVGWANSGANIFFYRSQGGDWKFAYAAQAPPECTSLVDTDAQKAYSETGCYANDSETTFGEYYNL